MIYKIHYNYNQALSNGTEVWPDNWETYEIGKNNVFDIDEHKPEHKGDLYYFNIYFSDGTSVKVFNPNQVFYSKIK